MLIIIFACDQVDDPASEVKPPSIKVDFVADTTFSLNNIRLAKADTLVDSLFIYKNKLIEEGNPDSVEAIALYEAQLAIKDSLSVINNQFKVGKVKIDQFLAINGSFIEEYQDTINSVFALPLNIHDTVSTYVFGYYDLKDTISFSYQTRTSYEIDRIVIRAFDLQVIRHTFDSLSRHYCQTDECTSGEITYKVYF